MLITKLKIGAPLTMSFCLSVYAAGILVAQPGAPGNPSNKVAQSEPSPPLRKHKPEAKIGNREHIDNRGDPLPEAAILRLGSARMRHGGGLHMSVLSPDGKTLATAGDHAVFIWDIETGNLKRRLPCDRVTFSRPGLTFSPDGTRLAHCRHSSFACVWDLRDGTEIVRIERPSNVKFDEMLNSECRFINQGQDLMIGTYSNIQIVNLESKQVTATVPSRARVLSPDGKTFLNKEKNVLVLHDANSGKAITQLDVVVHDEGFRDLLNYSADSKTIALLHDHREIQHRKLPGGELLATFPLSETIIRAFQEQKSKYWEYNLTFSADGRTLLMGTSHGLSCRWDLATKKELPPLSKFPAGVTGLHPMPDGRTLVSTCADGNIRRWDLATGRQIPEPESYEGRTAAAFSAHGQWAVIGDARGRVDLWDALRGERLRTLQEEGAPTHLAFAPGDKLLSMAERSGTTRFWKVPSGEAGPVWRQEDDKSNRFGLGIHFSPDGRLLCINDYPQQVRVMDAATGKLEWQSSRSYGDAFSSDGKTLIVAAPTGPYLTFIDTDSWMKRSTVRLKSQTSDGLGHTFRIACAPDGRNLAVIFDGGCLALCDGSTGEEKHRLVDFDFRIERIALASIRRNRPEAIAFSTDGRWLASGGSDTVVSIWEVDTGKEVLRLSGHDGQITKLAFHPDGRSLLSFASDGQGYRWNLMPKLPASPRPSLAEQWELLEKAEPAEVYATQWRMIADGKESVSFLRDRLKPIRSADAGKIQQWIGELNSDAFTVRDAASKKLLKVGEQVQVPIRKALSGDLPLEAQRRLKQVLETVTANPGPETARTIRAIMVLERIGSPEARYVLEALARGAPGARATEEAAAALKRLDKYSTPMPLR